jgi:enamine deaminase RidA (YjgF/YER057c/UK114 family)
MKTHVAQARVASIPHEARALASFFNHNICILSICLSIQRAVDLPAWYYLRPYHNEASMSSLVALRLASSAAQRGPISGSRLGRLAFNSFSTTAARIKELGIEMPAPGVPQANYSTICWETPTRLYVSGHLPVKPDGTKIVGCVGNGGLSLEQGQEAARWCGLGILATLEDTVGDLDRIEQVVKLFGIVNSKVDFTEQHLVLNGASNVMMEVLGDRGYHARSAIGTNTLPLGIAVEVEAIVKVKA